MNADLLKLINKGESETMEFKVAKSSFDNLAKTVCGFLNQQGGVLLWGVNDQGEVVGIDDAEQKSEKLTHKLMSNINPRPFLSVSIQQDKKGSSVVVVRVPPGSDKPYSFNRQIWVRIGSVTMRAGEKRSADMVEKSVMKAGRWEREPMPGFSVDDCDQQEMTDAVREIAAVGRFGVNIPNGNMGLMQSLYLQRSGRLTNASVLLFATNPRIWAPNIYVRIISYAKDKNGPIANDTIVSGPAVRTLKDAVSIIQQRTGFSGRFDKSVLPRDDRPAYALYVLREALVNAIVHSSYEEIGGFIRVEIYPEYLVISNPGHLPNGWTQKTLKGVHCSMPFNPDIARVFYLRKLMDQLGVGTQRLVSECKELGAKTPIWHVANGLISLKIFRAPEPVVEIEILERQSDFIQSLTPGDEFRAVDYMTATRVSERQGRRDLSDLEEKGLITRYGKGPATRYSLLVKKGAV